VVFSIHLVAGIVVLVVAMLVLGPVTSAQTKPDPVAAKTSGPPQTIIKTQVRQVLVDVVVTDSKNHAITGLKRKDFSVTEDGTPQNIISFETHTSASELTGIPALALPKLPENTFLNLKNVRDDLPLNIILYDVLNTPLTDQPFARREMQKFLMNKPSGSRCAIFVLSDKLHLLQGVTENESELLAAVNSHAAGNKAPALAAPSADTVSFSKSLSDASVMAQNPGATETLDRLQHMESVSTSFYLKRDVAITLKAFVELARFLRGIPGRKNLLWLSGSFPIGILPGGDPFHPFGGAVNFSPEVRQLTNQLTLSQVAVYPVDVRGLMVGPLSEKPDAGLQFWNQLVGEHDAMDEIAEASGGHAFFNTNGLEQAMQTATEDGSNYYRLTYSPSNTRFDGRLRKIHVRVGERGFHLSYRRNYFADDDFKLAQRRADVPLERTEATMQRGAPSEHELVFSVHAKSTGMPSPVTKDEIAGLAQFPSFAELKKWDGVKMQKFELDFSVLHKQISYVISPDGVRRGSLEFLYAAYDGDSNLLYRSISSGERTVSPEPSDKARTGTYRAKQILEIPANTA
jgi:VWFA-related protein